MAADQLPRAGGIEAGGVHVTEAGEQFVVNDNFHAGGPRVPFEADDPAYRLRRNPGWRNLRVGDLVRPNRRRGADPPDRRGRIMTIEGETARVRWQDRTEQQCQLSYLVRI